jgi:hypothetical protein
VTIGILGLSIIEACQMAMGDLPMAILFTIVIVVMAVVNMRTIITTTRSITVLGMIG